MQNGCIGGALDPDCISLILNICPSKSAHTSHAVGSAMYSYSVKPICSATSSNISVLIRACSVIIKRSELNVLVSNSFLIFLAVSLGFNPCIIARFNSRFKADFKADWLSHNLVDHVAFLNDALTIAVSSFLVVVTVLPNIPD